MPDPDPTVSPIHADPGPTVGLLSGYLPRELLHALGCTPVRIFPTAAKPTAAEAYLPRNFCALTRLILASFLEDGAAHLDAVIFTDEDDAARRLYDVWCAHLPLPAWGFVQVPRAATPLAVRRYAGLLARLSADLEARAGRPLRAPSLRQAIALYNRQRDLLANLKRHWLARYIDTVTYCRLRRAALTTAPLAANCQLEDTLAAVENGAPPHSAPPAAEPSPRLLLLAELAAPAGLVRLVEAAGAQVVAEDSDLDEGDLSAPVPADAETIEELLTALASAYLSKPPAPRMRDLPRRLAHVTNLVQGRRAHAAICAYNKFCDLYLAEFPTLKAHLEGLGAPVLLLELEDQALSGQHRTRVEAFLEMIGAGSAVPQAER